MPESLTVEIRQMKPEDTAAVAMLTTQLGYPSTEDEIRRRYDLIKDRWDARLFVAQHAGARIVGWIHVQATYMLEADARAAIWGLVVSEKARGTGVGRRLVEAAEEWALMRGLSVIVVNSNYLRLEAQGFYEHLGYKVTKTQNAFRKNLT
jgi:ribosomal protein S18 acetylase RimI-like enzyme